MLKLKEITEPKLEVELVSGEVKSWPLWDIYAKMEGALNKLSDRSVESVAATIREVTGIPDLSAGHCHHLYAEALGGVKELEISKKLLKLTQS